MIRKKDKLCITILNSGDTNRNVQCHLITWWVWFRLSIRLKYTSKRNLRSAKRHLFSFHFIYFFSIARRIVNTYAWPVLSCQISYNFVLISLFHQHKSTRFIVECPPTVTFPLMSLISVIRCKLYIPISTFTILRNWHSFNDSLITAKRCRMLS